MITPVAARYVPANTNSFSPLMVRRSASATILRLVCDTAAHRAEARAADGVALSTYARDNVAREDLAESLGPYLALRFRRDRLDGATSAQIEATIPNRMQYFDCVGLTLAPLR